MLTDFIYIFLSYLLGSLSFAVILCKIFGLPDPRSAGSNNPGATNVLRIAGKKVAALTLFGDGLKGAIAIILAKSLNLNVYIISLIMLAVFLGHLYPLFFRFKGGKGVATFLGILFALHWPLGIIFLVTWLVVLKLFNYSSLAAIVAAFTTPFFTYYLQGTQWIFPILGMVLLLLWRHKDNIKRLLKGQESKVNFNQK
ncbi:MAG: plsY [Francisellaceae bacterium]|nr:plsY [Francisellaceae bacterium]